MSETDHSGVAPSADGGIAFWGTVTASVTHELRNVISIIEQTAGLLDDLVKGEERGIPMSIERLSSVSASIQKQTRRGLGIIEHLNQFAHSTDVAEACFDLTETIGNLIELSRRPADMKQVGLAFKATPDPIKVTGNPFAIQHTVFEALLISFSGASAGTTVTVESDTADGDGIVTITYEGAEPSDQDGILLVERTLRTVQGSLTIEVLPPAVRLVMRFPRRPGS